MPRADTRVTVRVLLPLAAGAVMGAYVGTLAANRQGFGLAEMAVMLGAVLALGVVTALWAVLSV